MTNTIKQILGEDIPGSTDADVTGDEFLIDSGPRTIDHGNGITQEFDEYGTERWYKSGKFHRDNDLPAIIYGDGNKYWYRNGLVHRDGDKPAIVRKRSQEYWRNGKRTKMATS